MYSSAYRGYAVNKGTVELIFGPIATPASAKFKIRLASFSVTNGNGADATDTVIVSISIDGGTTYSEELLIKGNDNNKWGFDAVRAATTSYNGTNTPNSFTSGSGIHPTTGGISFLEVTGIPTSTNLKVKIEMKNNADNEIWVVDDAEIDIE
ncbi:hypothetical protein EI546_01120 [Aequorivita sp. H23M31]|uniref:Uncharacterized protein n=1 Tax=Aequorivita ciconiae TaxID=2494375 RepID=A0A410FZF7_9FLAO|nr:hypothetical protein [Aequorivita sp. H23M31]QAA80415.1 hypothetical protein EI546_01120 [Aequorivita sp. H23M31]